jgi:hypothetical protein
VTTIIRVRGLKIIYIKYFKVNIELIIIYVKY